MGRAGQVADWVASHEHIAKPLGLVKELKRQGAPKSGGVRNVLRFGRPFGRSNLMSLDMADMG